MDSSSDSEGDWSDGDPPYIPDHDASIASSEAILQGALPLPDESDPEFSQLRSYLSEALTIPGTSKFETEIVEWIQSRIASMPWIRPEDVNSKCRQFGTYALYFPPDLRETISDTGSGGPLCDVCDDGVLFECHCDIVRLPSEMIDPEFKTDRRRTVKATGLDNRLSCAIILNLLHFAETNGFKRSMVALFSVQEEIGYIGCRRFVSTISLSRRHRFRASEIYVLDGSFGRWADSRAPICPTFTLKNGLSFPVSTMFLGHSERIPPIGNGCLPFSQSFGVDDPTSFHGMCDLAPFCRSRRAEYQNAKKAFLAVPILDMHHAESFASMNDIFDLYCRCRDWMMGKSDATCLFEIPGSESS